MLALSRKLQEDVILILPDGRHVTAKLISTDRNKATIGFDAPPDVKIYRRELMDDISGETTRP